MNNRVEDPVFITFSTPLICCWYSNIWWGKNGNSTLYIRQLYMPWAELTKKLLLPKKEETMEWPYVFSRETVFDQFVVFDLFHMAALKFLDDYACQYFLKKSPRYVQVEKLYIRKIDQTVAVKFKFDNFSEYINLPNVTARTSYQILYLETMTDRELFWKVLCYRGDIAYNLTDLFSNRRYFIKKGKRIFILI